MFKFLITTLKFGFLECSAKVKPASCFVDGAFASCLLHWIFSLR